MNTALLIVLIVVVLFKDYITSFFKEKGKNAATKQDVADITEQMEAVKLEFSTLAKKQDHILKERFELVLQYINLYMDWTDNADFGNILNEQLDKANINMELINVYSNSLQKLSHKINILFQDDEFLKVEGEFLAALKTNSQLIINNLKKGMEVRSDLRSDKNQLDLLIAYDNTRVFVSRVKLKYLPLMIMFKKVLGVNESKQKNQ